MNSALSLPGQRLLFTCRGQAPLKVASESTLSQGQEHAGIDGKVRVWFGGIRCQEWDAKDVIPGIHIIA